MGIISSKNGFNYWIDETDGFQNSEEQKGSLKKIPSDNKK